MQLHAELSQTPRVQKPHSRRSLILCYPQQQHHHLLGPVALLKSYLGINQTAAPIENHLEEPGLKQNEGSPGGATHKFVLRNSLAILVACRSSVTSENFQQVVEIYLLLGHPSNCHKPHAFTWV